jgi:hypothetical protein
MGVSPLVYHTAIIREQNILNTLETSNPLLPPIGLKTNVISPYAIEVAWSDKTSEEDVSHEHFLNNWFIIY